MLHCIPLCYGAVDLQGPSLLAESEKFVINITAMQRALLYNIGIKHNFPFINIRKVPREVLKIEGKARGFQHLPRDLANVNE